MTIKEIIQAIEAVAPLALQEDYDNSGVQVGDVSQPVESALLCIDITEEVIDEALRKGIALIISHHPLLFKGLKSLTGKNYIERCVMKAVCHNMCLYSAHTNLDSSIRGVNKKIADILDIRNLEILSPQRDALLKLVTYVPKGYVETVRGSLFAAGAVALAITMPAVIIVRALVLSGRERRRNLLSENLESCIMNQKCVLR
jgi:Uncharacterized conserved protein